MTSDESAVFMHAMRANRIAQGLTQKQLAERVTNCGYPISGRALGTFERSARGWRIADSEQFRSAVSRALGVSRVIMLRTPMPNPCPYCHMRARSTRPCEACGY